MTMSHDNSHQMAMDNYWITFPNIYYCVIPSCISDDIKHKILELHFRNSVNTIIKIWRKIKSWRINIVKIRFKQHLQWVKSIYQPDFDNIDNIALIRRQNARPNLVI